MYTLYFLNHNNNHTLQYLGFDTLEEAYRYVYDYEEEGMVTGIAVVLDNAGIAYICDTMSSKEEVVNYVPHTQGYRFYMYDVWKYAQEKGWY